MTVTETMSDPASSLRALALSTLKSKRRKPTVVQPSATFASRPVPPPLLSSNTMQLDYGEDEFSESAQSPAPRRMESDHPLMREEGEISDEESTLKRQKVVPSASEMETDTPAPQPSSTPPPSTNSRNGGLSLLDRITDAPNVLPSSVEPSQSLSERISSPTPSTSITQSMSINDRQVRPNLHLNQSEYDTAKNIVLDLLGWGVAPEYLVDSGLSRELIYYVFTELNLRLPDNLDTTGLLPYNPDTIKSFTFIEPELSPREKAKDFSPAASFDALVGPTPHTFTPPSQEDLNGIERLRRQELVARKAVQASRRSRKSHSAGTATSEIPSETVEDFLKTIAPSTETVPSKPSSVDMDVEEPPLNHAPVELPTSPIHEEKQPSRSPILEPPPSSTESMTTTFDVAMRLSPEAAPVHQYPTRRGLKRPVASDFVDLDTNTRTVDRGQDISQNGTIYQPIRRKTGMTSFVNVRPTKCVIDLSDSEADEDDQPNTATTPQIPVPSTRSNSQRKMQAPPTSALTSGISTPGTLEEKEKEIRRMREWIAQREQRNSLKKKLGVKSTSSKDTKDSASTAEQSEVPPVPASTPSSIPPTLPSARSPRKSSISSTSPDSTDRGVTKKLQDHVPHRPKAEPVLFSSDQPLSPADGSVDVDIEMSSSAQVLEEPTLSHPGPSEFRVREMSTEEPHGNPMDHDSLFASYPLLRLSLQPSLAGAWSSWKELTPSPESSDHGVLSSTPLPDLKPLREACLLKQIDPTKFLCQFEVPGGGVCRDGSCEDVHLSKLTNGAEPNDHDTAKYLSSICDGLPFDSIFARLQQERQKNPTATLEQRVGQVLTYPRSSLPEPPPAT